MTRTSPHFPSLRPRAAFRGVRVTLFVAAVALPVAAAGAWLAGRPRPVPAALKPLPAAPDGPALDSVIVDPANSTGPFTVWGSSSYAGCGQVFLQVDTTTEAESTPESTGLPFDQIIAAAEAESHPPDAEPAAEAKAPPAAPRSVATKTSLTAAATGSPRR
jgi:hypothetical protein